MKPPAGTVRTESTRAFSPSFSRMSRRVVEPGYRLSFVDEASGREVQLSDPFDAHVRAFVASVRRGPPFPVDPVITTGVRRLVEVDSAWPSGR